MIAAECCKTRQVLGCHGLQAVLGSGEDRQGLLTIGPVVHKRAGIGAMQTNAHAHIRAGVVATQINAHGCARSRRGHGRARARA